MGTNRLDPAGRSFGEGAVFLLRHSGSVQEKVAIPHMDRVAGQPDNPLDEVLPVHWMPKDAMSRGSGSAAQDPPVERAHGEGTGVLRVPVGHLVDEQEIADEQRVFMEPDGIQKGWKKTVRNTPAMRSA